MKNNNKIVYIAASSVLVVSLGILGFITIDKIKQDKLTDELRDAHNSVTTTVATPPPLTQMTTTVAETTTVTTPAPLVILPEMVSFIDDNSDTSGWITVGGTNVDDIVLQTYDNEFYLSKDFNEEYSVAGSIYLDYRCVANEQNDLQSDNLVIYGHNQKDGTKFGTLKNYKIKSSDTSNFEFYKEHPTFEFSNLYENYTYKIIATFVSEATAEQDPNGEWFDYHNYINFDDGNYSFEKYKTIVESRSAIITGVDYNEDDKYITLSTCSNEFDNSRFVIIGRRVREDESTFVDTSKATINEDMKEPDLNFIYNK